MFWDNLERKRLTWIRNRDYCMAISFGSSKNEIQLINYKDNFDDSEVLSEVNKEYSKEWLFG